MRDAGIIGFVPRGEYSPAETYDFLQFVYYNGSTYVAKKETTGNAPVENNEFWQILAKGQLTGVSGVKGEKVTNFRKGDVNITAENVGALPIVGGTLTQKAKYGSTLKLTNENENSDISLDLIPTNCPTRIRLQANSRVNEAVFEIYDVEDGVKSTELFSVSRAGRRIIYDKKTNSVKQILIEGEALPVTGGQIDSPKFDPLVIRRTEDNPVGIRLVNLKGPLLNIQSSLDGDLPVFSVFDARNDMYLIQISKKVRKIYDYKTGEMKQIAIEDDVKYKAGDTVKIIANNMFSGCLTTSGTEIYFTIPLEKSAAGLQATIAGWIRVRGIDGYLINSENVADYDVSCFSRQNIVNNLLSFRVRKNDKSAFSAKNNFPVAVDGDFTITFS